MDIDLAELRRITRNVQEELSAAEKLIMDAKEKAEAQIAQTRADKIIACIPNIAMEEAKKGKDRAIIMLLDHLTSSIEKLKGAGKLVFAYCMESGLNPTLEWNDHTGGDVGRHEIVIHW